MAIKIDATTLYNGGVMEQLNAAIEEAVRNVQDVNTPATATRKVQLTITIKPDDSRSLAKVEMLCKTALAPREAIKTNIQMAQNIATGEVLAEEICPGENLNQTAIPQVFDNGRMVAKQ